MMNTYKQHWTKLIQREARGYREVLTWDPYEDWSSQIKPEMATEQALLSAMELLCGDYSGSEVTTYLKRSIMLSERILREKKCFDKRCKRFLPINHALTLRSLAYARWFAGHGLNKDLVVQACVDIEHWCEQLKGSE
jgi:hypothetical protein